VTRVVGARLAVRTADCVPIVLHADGVVAVVHAGWKGLAGGVLEATMAVMGVRPEVAIVGPHIRRGCYEFGIEDLDEVVASLGPHVRATTSWGTPALDLTAGAHRLLEGIAITDAGACTACSDLYFSHRARREAERFATIAWLEP
jgi:copper oxidase (laccase) domain-containing protein